MPSFLNSEQQSLALEIAALATGRGQTIAVAEGTTGGLISAALLWVPGASQYYAGGGVLYTLKSRVLLAGADAALFENYQGTTPAMVEAVAEAMRYRLSSTWCIAESGLAGPTGGRSGAPPGRTTVGVAGPVVRTEVFETGSSDREANMIEFATIGLRLLRDVLVTESV